MHRIGITPPRLPGAPPSFPRRLRAALRGTRFRLERATAGRTRGGAGGTAPLLAPVHLSLRDSRTLNLALDASAAGATDRARLLITRGRRRLAVPLAHERHTAGIPLLTATVTLRDMGDGVWRLTVETRGADGRVRRRGLAPAGDVAPLATPTLPHAPDPLTGTLVRIVRCRGGRAALQATRARPRAELVRFEPRGDGITVHGRPVGTAHPAPGRSAEAVRRRDKEAVPVDVEWSGAAFTLRVPLAAMTGAGAGQWVWDFRVGGLPLGRWLSDVRDPAAACPTPFRVFALPGGALVRAHAHFTGTGAFAVTCWDITDLVRTHEPATPKSAKETS
ncbi:Transferase OS=Streptomyces alboniger OX=132473 GN=CP975_13495 PE=4 SV=1 [Streptomyces alboniger]